MDGSSAKWDVARLPSLTKGEYQPIGFGTLYVFGTFVRFNTQRRGRAVHAPGVLHCQSTSRTSRPRPRRSPLQINVADEPSTPPAFSTANQHRGRAVHAPGVLHLWKCCFYGTFAGGADDIDAVWKRLTCFIQSRECPYIGADGGIDADAA